jgi:hypothetical protein
MQYFIEINTFQTLFSYQKKEIDKIDEHGIKKSQNWFSVVNHMFLNKLFTIRVKTLLSLFEIVANYLKF